MNNIENDDSQVEKRVNDALDSSIEDLHPDIRRKLNQARIKALQSTTAMPFFKKPVWKIAGAVGFVITLSFITISNKQELSERSNTIAENSGTEKPMIFENSLSNEEIILLENLEFALWMAEEVEIASL
ncbi:MAG: hypothetical protein COA86_07930 [Kangiella sp.]|nr:MAG: hypothetical protein COA86_07930 [Kangiella sp.]